VVKVMRFTYGKLPNGKKIRGIGIFTILTPEGTERRDIKEYRILKDTKLMLLVLKPKPGHIALPFPLKYIPFEGTRTVTYRLSEIFMVR
jgi:hypothetical protein